MVAELEMAEGTGTVGFGSHRRTNVQFDCQELQQHYDQQRSMQIQNLKLEAGFHNNQRSTTLSSKITCDTYSEPIGRTGVSTGMS